MSTSIREYINDKRSYFINLIQNFSDLIKRYNQGEFTKNKEGFYEDINILKKEIYKAELFNPKSEKPLNYFSDPSNEGNFSYDLMQVLRNFSKIKDELLNDPKFYNEVQDIFETILYALAFDTYNIGDFAEIIAKVFNKMTREKYFLVVCDHLQGDKDFKVYNCGRAFMQHVSGEPRFIIFNTNSDGQPDRSIFEKYGEKTESDITLSPIYLSNDHDSPSLREEFIHEVLIYKKEEGVNKEELLKKFFNRIFDKIFYEKPKGLNINLDFKLSIPILDLDYDIIFEITLKKDNKVKKYKFYTLIKDSSMFGPKVLTQVEYSPEGETTSYQNSEIQTILLDLYKLV